MSCHRVSVTFPLFRAYFVKTKVVVAWNSTFFYVLIVSSIFGAYCYKIIRIHIYFFKSFELFHFFVLNTQIALNLGSNQPHFRPFSYHWQLLLQCLPKQKKCLMQISFFLFNKHRLSHLVTQPFARRQRISAKRSLVLWVWRSCKVKQT